MLLNPPCSQHPISTPGPLAILEGADNMKGVFGMWGVVLNLLGCTAFSGCLFEA